MFCKNCGKELKEGAKFCTGCGTAVTFPKSLDEADRPVTPKPYEQDIPESVPSPHIYENTAQVNAPHEAKKPKYKAAVIALCIAGGMVLAIAIPIVLIFLFGSPSKTTDSYNGGSHNYTEKQTASSSSDKSYSSGYSMSGYDADTFASLAVRYFKNELENNVRTEISSDKKTIYFYDSGVSNSADYFMSVSLKEANNISYGISIYYDSELAGYFIEQGNVNTVLIMMSPCIASYLSLTESESVSLDKVAELLRQNVNELGNFGVGSYASYGQSTVSLTISNSQRLGWIVSASCDSY
ncbi:MAG: zinc-ribbon domain-containing protein [Clostridia bacterium]|nr:zinc-ribbon domain-containing protein [Clostridia bacterium]